MTLALALAPAATLAVFALIAAGIHWLSEEPSALTRSRLDTFAPTKSAESGPALLSPLIGPARFSDIPSLQHFLQREQWGERISEELSRAGMSLRAGEYILMRLVLAVLAAGVAWAASHSLLLAPLAGAAGCMAPAVYVRWRRRRRNREFDDQLVDALVLISNSLSAGFSFLQAMQAVADEMTEPIGVEFRQALVEARMGGAMDEAMLKIAKRVESVDFGLIVTGLAIQRQVGGNLTEIINNVVHTVRERHRIHREIRSLTGEQRLSGWILGLLPLVLTVILTVMQPTYVPGMWAVSTGRLMLGAAAFMDVLGLLAIRKLVEIEV